MFKSHNLKTYLFVFFLLFFLSLTSSLADTSTVNTGVVIVWDKSGSMYRLNGKTRMDEQDLLRLNRILTEVLFDGTTSSVDPALGDKILVQKYMEPILSPSNKILFLYFGLECVRKDGPQNTNPEGLLKALPSHLNPKNTYRESNTYFRKAIVEAFDEAQAFHAGKKYIVSISDEGESAHIKIPDIEKRFDKLIKTYPLIGHILIKNIVEVRIFALQEPDPSPAPTFSPNPTSTPEPTSSPVPSLTPTPEPTAVINLLDTHNAAVKHIYFRKSGIKTPVMMESSEALHWQKQGRTDTYLKGTRAEFANGQTIDIRQLDNGSFTLTTTENTFNTAKQKDYLVLSIPVAGDGLKTEMHQVRVSFSMAGAWIYVIGWSLFIIVFFGMVILSIFFFQSPFVADVNLTVALPRSVSDSFRLFEGDKLFLGDHVGQKNLDLGLSQYCLIFENNKLRFLNEKTGEKIRISWGRKKRIRQEESGGLERELDIVVQASLRRQFGKTRKLSPSKPNRSQ